MKKVNFLSIFSCITGILIITPYIDNYNYAYLSKKGVVEKDILFKTIGEAKILLSDFAYLTSDIYFHGGRGHLFEEKHEECITHPGEPCEHARENISVPGFNFLARLAEKLELHKHRHLSGEEEKETLPWFYYAAKLNPHNIDAYVLGGYQAGMILDQPDEGIRFLKEGLRHNPNSWKIHEEIGNIFRKKKEDHEKAIIYYEKAYSLFTAKNSDKYDRRTVLTFLGVLYEETGDNSKAINIYREILRDFPDNETLRQKIEDLAID